MQLISCCTLSCASSSPSSGTPSRSTAVDHRLAAALLERVHRRLLHLTHHAPLHTTMRIESSRAHRSTIPSMTAAGKSGKPLATSAAGWGCRGGSSPAPTPPLAPGPLEFVLWQQRCHWAAGKGGQSRTSEVERSRGFLFLQRRRRTTTIAKRAWRSGPGRTSSGTQWNESNMHRAKPPPLAMQLANFFHETIAAAAWPKLTEQRVRMGACEKPRPPQFVPRVPAVVFNLLRGDV